MNGASFTLAIMAERDDGSVTSLHGDWRLGTDTGRAMAIAKAQARPWHRRVWIRAINAETGEHEEFAERGYEVLRGRDY